MSVDTPVGVTEAKSIVGATVAASIVAVAVEVFVAVGVLVAFAVGVALAVAVGDEVTRGVSVNGVRVELTMMRAVVVRVGVGVGVRVRWASGEADALLNPNKTAMSIAATME